jgi:cell division protein FtsQ
MWDNAPLLRNIANALLVFSVCAVLYGAAYYAAHLPGLFPLNSVRLSAAPQRVDTAEVMQVVRNEVRGNFFTVDIERLRQSLEKLPWVRNVSIRREFPQRLAVRLEEHQALARWNNNALVNRQGEVFVAKSERVMPEASGTPRPPLYGGSEQALPRFTGQDGAAADVAQHYAQFSQQVAALDLQVTQLALSPRHAWQLRLSNGMVLELGREDMQQRLARFVEVYPYSLAAIQSQVKFVDLRYRNGFAVSGLVNSGLAKQG